MLSDKSLLKWILLVQTVSHVFTIEVTLTPDYNPLEMPDTDGKPLEIECFFRIGIYVILTVFVFPLTIFPRQNDKS